MLLYIQYFTVIFNFKEFYTFINACIRAHDANFEICPWQGTC